MTQWDVIILGAGAMGSAAAWSLALRGQRVLVLEQFGSIHDRGSSHGATRITRKAYFEHPDYVPLVELANQRWRKLEHASSESLMHRVGLLLIGPEDGAIISGTRRAQQKHGWPIEALSESACAARYPQFVIPSGSAAVLEPHAGYLRVEEALAAFQNRAALAGAVFHWREPVLSWQADDDGVVVRTRQDAYRAARLVVCAGAWTSSILRDLSVELTVLRIPQFWFATQDDGYNTAKGSPIFGYEIDDRFFYGFPSVDGTTIKVAEHMRRELVESPDKLKRDVSDADAVEVAAFAERHLKIMSSRPVRASVCMYTMTRDEHFVVDRHPTHSSVCFAAGFSGHGFKFAPLVGDMLAGLVLEDDRLPVPSMWRLDRAGLRAGQAER